MDLPYKADKWYWVDTVTPKGKGVQRLQCLGSSDDPEYPVVAFIVEKKESVSELIEVCDVMFVDSTEVHMFPMEGEDLL